MLHTWRQRTSMAKPTSNPKMPCKYSQICVRLQTALANNAFHVECDCPDTNMYKLNATVTRNQDKYPIDLQMMLLRGTVLRNTDWVIGIVLFTGADTR